MNTARRGQSGDPEPMPTSPAESHAAPNWSSMKTSEHRSHRKRVHALAWSCTGDKLASGSVDQSIRVWSFAAGAANGAASEMELTGHQESVDQLRWDPKNPDVLGSASIDKTVRIWDVRTGKCAHAIETKGENINIRWSPDGQYVGVGDREDNISFIDMRKCKLLKNIKFAVEVNEMAWDASSNYLFLTTGSGTVEVYRYAEMLRAAEAVAEHQLIAHTSNCYCIEFDPKGEHFAVGGADAIVSVWNSAELVCVRTCTRLEWPIRTVSFSHDCEYVASAGEDRFIDIAHVASGTQAHSIAVKEPINSLSWHPKRALLAYAGDDKDRQGRDDGVLRIFGW